MWLCKNISDESWGRNQVLATAKFWPQSCEKVVEMSSNKAGCLDFGCSCSVCDQCHEKHGIWYPLSWDCEDEEVGLHASVILGRCVGKSQYKTGREYHSACDEDVQAQDCEADEQNVCHEVSRLREPWGSCLKLAPICVQEVCVEDNAQVFFRYEE